MGLLHFGTRPRRIVHEVQPKLSITSAFWGSRTRCDSRLLHPPSRDARDRERRQLHVARERCPARQADPVRRRGAARASGALESTSRLRVGKSRPACAPAARTPTGVVRRRRGPCAGRWLAARRAPGRRLRPRPRRAPPAADPAATAHRRARGHGLRAPQRGDCAVEVAAAPASAASPAAAAAPGAPAADNHLAAPRRLRRRRCSADAEARRRRDRRRSRTPPTRYAVVPARSGGRPDRVRRAQAGLRPALSGGRPGGRRGRHRRPRRGGATLPELGAAARGATTAARASRRLDAARRRRRLAPP